MAMAKGCPCCMFGVVHVAFVGLLLVALLVVLAVLALLVACLLLLYKLCTVALSSPSVTSAPDRVFKLRRSTVLIPSSNSFCCPWLALNSGLHDASQTATWTLARAPLVSPPFGCLSSNTLLMGNSCFEDCEYPH